MSKLAADAQAARVTIYALALEMPVFDATQARVSPTATRDRQVREDGIEQVAGAARGAVFRLVGDDPSPFARISRELSGHYLLAFEAADGDRDARAHRIRVTLTRGGYQVRGAHAFHDARGGAAGARRAAERRCYARSRPASELPLRVATYTYAEPARRALRVVISAEAGARRASAWLGFVLIDPAGVIAATAAQESRAGQYAFSAVVPEGRYTLRAAAIDAMGRQGSVERDFLARLGGTTRVARGRPDAGARARDARRAAVADRRSRDRRCGRRVPRVPDSPGRRRVPEVRVAIARSGRRIRRWSPPSRP